MSQSLKTLFFLFSVLFATSVFGQEVSKKAIKFTEKAEEAIKQRQFDAAKEYLNKAISADANYTAPYFRLSTIYNLYLQFDSAALYYNRALSVMKEGEITQKMWERAAGLNYGVGNYEEAFRAISHVSNPDERLSASIQLSKESVERGIQINQEELPEAINAYELQYFPTLTVDENTIIYTKRNSGAPSSDEDLMISTRINGQWIPAQSISKEINTPFNEGASTISADGRTLIFTACEGRPSFGSCDLYITQREGNKWTKPENIGATVNSRYWESQPSLGADGRVLYFASNRPGGVGKRDLYVTKITAKGWSTPQNLGREINTQYDETTPFAHVNGKTLFFSSEGHPGLGGFDLFVTEKNDTSWLKPRNLGYPINTLHDEISLFINASGTHGYYAKERNLQGKVLSSKIVKFPLPGDTLVKSKSSYVVGRVMDEVSKEPLGASLRMTNLNDSTDTYFIRSDSTSGRYFLVLTEGNQYGVFVKRMNYLFEDMSITASESSALEPDTIDIYLKPIRGGESITLENIYFRTDEYRLDEKSKSELAELAEFIKENPTRSFLIEGHTDNVGTESYNQELSTKRAETVYNYLVDHQVPLNRIQFKGYGSSRPIGSNESEAGKKKNRRITVSVM
ncbi:MAG: OmpA family protein [Marinoscillum sp.]